MLEGFYTLEELARKARRSPRTILRWCDEPDGLEYTKAGATRLFTDEWLLAFLNRRKRQNNPSNPRRGRRERQPERRDARGSP
jgi:hypothetical protein